MNRQQLLLTTSGETIEENDAGRAFGRDVFHLRTNLSVTWHTKIGLQA